MKNVSNILKNITLFTLIVFLVILRIVYLFVVNYYPYIILGVVLYMAFKYRNFLTKVIVKTYSKIKNFKSVLPKNEVETIQELIHEIKSKGKLTDKDRNNIDLLNIKLKQLQSV